MKNDLSGQKINMLTVIKEVGKAKDRHIKWLCKCECGNYTTINSNLLKSKKIISCGCYKRKRTSEIFSIHNLAKTKLYFIWEGLKQRCLNPKNKAFRFYGARGITVCNEWQEDFCLFQKWALNNGYKEGLSIERINVNGNYEPENCKWIPTSEQYLNTRKIQFIEYNGEINTINYFSNKYNISHSTFRRHLKKGETPEQIIEKHKKEKD